MAKIYNFSSYVKDIKKKTKRIVKATSSIKNIESSKDIKHIYSLIDTINDPYEKDNLRYQAAIEIAFSEYEEVIDKLIPNLKSSDGRIKIFSCIALAWEGNTKVIEYMLPLVDDANDDVALCAIDALCAIGSGYALSYLIKKLDFFHDVKKNELAGKILEEPDSFDEDIIIKLLVPLLHYDEIKFRIFALATLSFLEHPAVIDVLIENLEHDDQRIRFITADLLGDMETIKVIKPLKELLRKETNIFVYNVAKDAILRVTGKAT